MDGLVFDRRPIFQWKLLCICCCMYVVLHYTNHHTLNFPSIFSFMMMTWWKKWWNFYLVIYQISTKRLPTLVLNVETSHYLSEISKSREKRILKMLWKCQIFPLRVPVVIEMCCCVGKCPVGSQKTILSYAPIEDRECHCHFLVWMLSLIRKRWDLHYHWPLVIW